MARGSDQAKAAATDASGLSKTYSGNAGALFAPLSGTLLSEAAHPSGIKPTTMAQMDTAAIQTAGGSNAGAVGQGGLMAARTRNAGGADAAIGSSVRAGAQTASKGILANRVKGAEVEEGQRRSALAGLGNLFGENATAGNQALGQVAPNVNADTNAAKQSWSWATDLFNPIMSNLSYSKGGFSV